MDNSNLAFRIRVTTTSIFYCVTLNSLEVVTWSVLIDTRQLCGPFEFKWSEEPMAVILHTLASVMFGYYGRAVPISSQGHRWDAF